VSREDGLGSPTVGIWRAEILTGTPVNEGQRLGRVSCAGRWVEVFAPKGVLGCASNILPSGTWVNYGQPLLELVASAVLQHAESATVAVDTSSDLPNGVLEVRADTDGTVYLRPDPQSPLFVELGEQVAERATLGLIEVMKTFSPVRETVAGTVERILVADGDSVQMGAPLFWLRPLTV